MLSAFKSTLEACVRSCSLQMRSGHAEHAYTLRLLEPGLYICNPKAFIQSIRHTLPNSLAA